MATNFNNQNVKQTVVERFFEGVFSVSEQWAQAFDYRRNDIADLRISPITGVASRCSFSVSPIGWSSARRNRPSARPDSP